MKVIVASLLKWHGQTGVQTHVREIFPMLRMHKIHPEFVCPHGGFLYIKFLLYMLVIVRFVFDRMFPSWGVHIYRYGHGWLLRRCLKKRLSSGEPCVVYAQCPVSARAALMARNKLTQKVILVVHFNISQADEFVGQGRLEKGSVQYKSIQSFELDTLPRLDGVVYVSEFMRNELLMRIPSLGDVPSRVIPNFLDDPGNQIGVGNSEGDLLCVGSLENRKNQSYALLIVAAAKKMGMTIRVTFVGNGPDKLRLELLAANLGIADQVYFAGFLRGAAQLFPKYKACLHVARIENMPLTLIEALSRGVPLIAPAVGGIPEIFSNGSEGIYIPLDDPEAAARKIIDFLGSVELLETAKNSARLRFLNKFESSAVSSEVYCFFKEICGE